MAQPSESEDQAVHLGIVARQVRQGCAERVERRFERRVQHGLAMRRVGHIVQGKSQPLPAEPFQKPLDRIPATQISRG